MRIHRPRRPPSFATKLALQFRSFHFGEINNLHPIESPGWAYAQFIASESKDPELRSWLDDVRSGRATSYAKDSQWDPKDFAPIASEIRKLFKKQGWMFERNR
jgi:hypothetical protein